MALPKTPPTEISNVSEARRQFSETLDRVRRHEARVVVEKRGIPVGAIVSIEDLKVIESNDRNKVALLEALDETRRAFDGIPPEEIEEEIWKAIADVKAESRKKRLSSDQ
jgi:prevent-host-death family protein